MAKITVTLILAFFFTGFGRSVLSNFEALGGAWLVWLPWPGWLGGLPWIGCLGLAGLACPGLALLKRLLRAFP